jgi:hypothetical protein
MRSLVSEVRIESRCTSSACASGVSSAYGVVKSVRRNTIDCPDCGSVLVWVKNKGKFPMREHISDRKRSLESKKTYMDY